MNGLTLTQNTHLTSGLSIPVALPIGIPVTTTNVARVGPPVAEQGTNWDGTVLHSSSTFCIRGGQS